MTTFRLLKQFNEPDRARSVDRRKRIGPPDAAAFPGDGLADKLARALCEHRATRFRELVEAFEFFALARKFARAPAVVDLCGGHGLVAALFVVFEPEVERALVIDKRRTQDFDLVLAATAEVAPWTRGRVTFAESRIENARSQLPERAGYVAVHACGRRTDTALDLAIADRAPIAAMPCCHAVGASVAPAALKQQFGDAAVDIERTYRLEREGYAVRWDHVSPLITRKNRVLLGRPKPR
ncbi:MAG: hypothetical protein R3F29_01475 [Planctomycetota bacterium]